MNFIRPNLYCESIKVRNIKSMLKEGQKVQTLSHTALGEMPNLNLVHTLELS